MGKALVVLSLTLLWSQESSAFTASLWNYFKQYQLGIEYSQSFDRVELSYDTDLDLAQNDSCDMENDDLVCRLSMLAGQSSGYGIFLQQAFNRRSDFHLAFDLAFGLRYLSGGTPQQEADELLSDGLPLHRASFALVSIIALPYVQVGFTPASRFPDILLSIGPAIQTAVGQVRINDESKDVVVAMTSGLVGYVELELVLLRFGKGAFSVYAARDSAGAESTDFYPVDLDHIQNIRAEFQRGTGGQFNGFGAKLVLNWP